MRATAARERVLLLAAPAGRSSSTRARSSPPAASWCSSSPTVQRPPAARRSPATLGANQRGFGGDVARSLRRERLRDARIVAKGNAPRLLRI
jgi:hypothetical protein